MQSLKHYVNSIYIMCVCNIYIIYTYTHIMYILYVCINILKLHLFFINQSDYYY